MFCMEIKDVMRKRRSINSYLDKSVKMEVIAEILDLAREAPSSGNLQNWKVIVVDDKEKKKRVSEVCLKQEWMKKAAYHLVICNDYENIVRMYGTRGKDLYSVQNCAAFTQNILLLAKNFGLDSCWVGAFDAEKIKMIFRIPDQIRPEAIVTIGYGDETKESSRLQIDRFCHFNEFGSSTLIKAPARIVSEKVEEKKGFFKRLLGRK
jgi:nitroreductase